MSPRRIESTELLNLACDAALSLNERGVYITINHLGQAGVQSVSV